MSAKREKIKEEQLQGFKYFKAIAGMLESLHEAGCQRDRAGMKCSVGTLPAWLMKTNCWPTSPNSKNKTNHAGADCTRSQAAVNALPADKLHPMTVNII